MERAVVKNLRLAGSFTSNNRRGLVAAQARESVCERIFIDAQMPKGSATNEQYSGVLIGYNLPYYNGSNQDTTKSYALVARDICIICNIESIAHAASISYGFTKEVERCTIIGKYVSGLTSYNIGVYDSIVSDFPLEQTEDNVFVNDVFIKKLMNGGQNDYRAGFMYRNNSLVIKHIKNILDMSKSLNNNTAYNETIGSVVYFNDSEKPKLQNIYTTNQSRENFTSSLNRKTYSGTKKTFNELCSMDRFNDNWLKGSVGTAVINNQYATEIKVLRAAKEENYYGGY
jgi:hypothetical protein